jgi:hypothetical protein
MNKKTAILIGALVVIVVGLTAFWQFYGPKSSSNQPAQVINSQNQGEERIITALHQFSKGKHIIAGEVDLPTPCHVINQNVTYTSVNPDKINIDYITSTKDELCAQVLTATRYKINFPASENVEITATWNGAPAQLNLVPVGADENLENFEVFIKG